MPDARTFLVRAILVVSLAAATTAPGSAEAGPRDTADEEPSVGAVVEPRDRGTKPPGQAEAGEKAGAKSPALAPDPYLWLEDVDGDRAMEWVTTHNAETFARLEAGPLYDELYRDALAVLNSESRLPEVEWKGKYLYDLWQDEEHPRGLYRRTTLEELRKGDPAWEVVLDVDALGAAEGKPWVFHGMGCLPPEHRRCLVDLSPGGGDAGEIREFDAEKLAFVPDGFSVPVAKTQVSWIDADHVFVATDFGPGSLTDSGYPRIVKRWRRGQPLAEAETVYEADPSSVRAVGVRLRTDTEDLDVVVDVETFWASKKHQLVAGELHLLALPEVTELHDAYRGRLVIEVKEDWSWKGETFRAGTVLVADPAALRGGEGKVEALVVPGEREVVEAVSATSAGILVTMLDNVRGRLDRYRETEGGAWEKQSVAFPDNGDLSVVATEDERGDFFVEYQSFLTPPTLFYVPGEGLAPEAVASQEPTFDSSRFAVAQHWATSADGTEVPYFVVHPKNLEMDGKNPTHIFSYGGFRNALKPSYSGSYEALHGAYGKLWLERGGVFVLANIRGGGEFGPSWHEAALLRDRHKAFEDFEAIARDLVARGITSPEHLGIEGRSNGGLLVTATLARHPELYGAVVAGVPLTDMKRYHKLLAGASWMAEYGDPDDPEDWAYLATYSPYHRLRSEVSYPPIFFYTSTRDDRVHPGHARKFAARLEELGHEVWYYENVEGGHGGSATNEQLARRVALAYAHLWSHLGEGQGEDPSHDDGEPAG